MITQLLIGLAALAASVAVHGAFMQAAIAFFRHVEAGHRSGFEKWALTAGVVLWFFLSICVICWGWSMLLIYLGAIEGLEEALYFSTVTFTTLGYGDVVLGTDWRLLGAFMAGNGTIIVGWTTAMVFVAVRQIYDGMDE
ncbi:MAG: potassium channel family protein [Pseudomonadota bacterium]